MTKGPKLAGYAHIVVIKRPPESEYDDGHSIIHCVTFDHLRLSPQSHDWMTEEVSSADNEFLTEWLKDKQDGFYELLGEFWYESWQVGYEEIEWEGYWELRNIKHQQLKFKDAAMFDNDGLLTWQRPDVAVQYDENGLEIRAWHVRSMRDSSIYAPLKDILCDATITHTANASLEELKVLFEALPDDEHKKNYSALLAEKALFVAQDFNSNVDGADNGLDPSVVRKAS